MICTYYIFSLGIILVIYYEFFYVPVLFLWLALWLLYQYTNNEEYWTELYYHWVSTLNSTFIINTSNFPIFLEINYMHLRHLI